MKRAHSLVRMLPVILVLLGLAGCQTEQTTRSGDIGVDRKQKMTSLVSSKEVEQQASQQYAQVLAGASKKGLLNQNPQEVQRVRAIADRLIAQVKVFRDDAPAVEVGG